nr:MarR family transcriptional regulator [Pseudonocardia sp. C8]
MEASEPLSLLLTTLERFANQRIRTTVLASEGLSVDQWRVMWSIYRGGGCSMSEVAERAVVSTTTLTRIIDKLTAQSVLYRHVDTSNRRRTPLYLSDRGARLTERVRARVDEVESEIFGNGGNSPECLQGVMRRAGAAWSQSFENSHLS